MRTVMVLAGLLLAMVSAGCGAEPKPVDDSLDDLQGALVDEGYLAHGVSYDTVTDHVVGINAILDSDKPAVVEAGAKRAAQRIAEIVWTTFPGEVSDVKVRINSGGTFDLRADELTGKFGERPDGLVDEDATVTVAVIVAGVLLAGLVVLVWWRRRNRAEEPK